MQILNLSLAGIGTSITPFELTLLMHGSKEQQATDNQTLIALND